VWGKPSTDWVGVIKEKARKAQLLASRLISSKPSTSLSPFPGGSMKMKMSSARVSMAHDWKIAEAAWLHLRKSRSVLGRRVAVPSAAPQLF